MTTAKNVLPVPAGPIPKVSVDDSIARMRCRWPAVRGRKLAAVVRAQQRRRNRRIACHLGVGGRQRDVVGRDMRAVNCGLQHAFDDVLGARDRCIVSCQQQVIAVGMNRYAERRFKGR